MAAPLPATGGPRSGQWGVSGLPVKKMRSCENAYIPFGGRKMVPSPMSGFLAALAAYRRLAAGLVRPRWRPQRSPMATEDLDYRIFYDQLLRDSTEDCECYHHVWRKAYATKLIAAINLMADLKPLLAAEQHQALRERVEAFAPP